MHPRPGALELFNRSLSVFPTMVCTSLPTPTTSHSSYWTGTNCSINSSQTSILDELTTKAAPERLDDNNYCVLVDPSTLVQPATRPTLHTKSGDSNPALDAHQASEQFSFVDSDRCFAIIQALKSSSLETQVSDTVSLGPKILILSQIFNSISPAEFNHIISLSSEQKRSKVSVK